MNPKFTKFLEDNKDMTLMGLAWALGWRLYLCVAGIVILLAIISNLD
jgi:hypothetical protein